MNNSPGEQIRFVVKPLPSNRAVVLRQAFFGLLVCSVVAPTPAQDGPTPNPDSKTVSTPVKSSDSSQADSTKTQSNPANSKPANVKKSADAADSKSEASEKSKSGDKAGGKTNLISEEFPKGWKYFSAESGTRLSDVWRVQKDDDPRRNILICKGMPEGYLRTEVDFEDFEMGLEWMYPTDKNGNSGVLLNMAPKDKIWPDSIQLQLHRPTAGSMFPSGDGKSENTLELRDLSVELNKWNTCRISSRGGRLDVEVNGRNVGEVRGCIPARGRIALQSEGSEIHFRKIWIRKLKPELPKSTVEAETKVNVKASGT